MALRAGRLHLVAVVTLVVLCLEPSLAGTAAAGRLASRAPLPLGQRPSLLRLPPHIQKGREITARPDVSGLLQSSIDMRTHTTAAQAATSWIGENLFVVIILAVVAVAALTLMIRKTGMGLTGRGLHAAPPPAPSPSPAAVDPGCPFFDASEKSTYPPNNPCHHLACAENFYDARGCEEAVAAFCIDPTQAANPGCLQYSPDVLRGQQDQYLWVCLRDIYPVDDTTAAGLNRTQSEALSTYATHAYILLGPTIEDSTAWDLTLEEHEEKWNEVLDTVKTSMDTKYPVEFGAELAKTVRGTATVNEVEGLDVHDKCTKCMKSRKPSTCDAQDIRSFASDYLRTHKDFSLDDKNCAEFACDVVSHCVPQGKRTTCDERQCKSNLMYKPIKDKSTGCNMREDPMNVADTMPLGADTLSHRFFMSGVTGGGGAMSRMLLSPGPASPPLADADEGQPTAAPAGEDFFAVGVSEAVPSSPTTTEGEDFFALGVSEAVPSSPTTTTTTEPFFGDGPEGAIDASDDSTDTATHPDITSESFFSDGADSPMSQPTSAHPTTPIPVAHANDNEGQAWRPHTSAFAKRVAQATSQQDGATPQQDEAATQREDGDTPQQDEAATQREDGLDQSIEAAPQLEPSTTEPAETTPQSEPTTPEPAEATLPNPAEAAPQSEPTTPELAEAASQPDVTAQAAEDTMQPAEAARQPEAQTSSQLIDQAASSPADQTTPERIDQTTPEPQGQTTPQPVDQVMSQTADATTPDPSGQTVPQPVDPATSQTGVEPTAGEADKKASLEMEMLQLRLPRGAGGAGHRLDGPVPAAGPN